VLDEVNEMLIFSFVRFGNNGTKDCTKIKIPDMIEVKDIKYALIGFVPHLGKSVKSGHYVKCYKSNNEWMVINDSNIYKLEDDSLREKSYMCCFKRVDGITFGPLPTSKYVEATRNNKLVLTNEQ